MNPRAFAPFLAFWLVVNVLDIVLTIIGLQRGIPEGNPVMAAILAHYGLVGMDAAKARNSAKTTDARACGMRSSMRYGSTTRARWPTR